LVVCNLFKNIWHFFKRFNIVLVVSCITNSESQQVIKHEVIELFIVLSSIIIFQTIDFVDYFFIIVNGFVNIANLGKNVSEGWLD